VSQKPNREIDEKWQYRKAQMLRTISIAPDESSKTSLPKNGEKSVLAPLIFLSIAYEWLISGANKIASGKFVSGLRQQLNHAIPDLQYKFYGHLLRAVAIPHARLIGTLVEYGEVFVGLSFVLLAVTFWRKSEPKSVLAAGAIAAALGALMSLSFFFLQGGAFFLNPGYPFDEGIPIDLIFVLLHASIAIYLFKRLRDFS